ncbi:MAG: hypothetical protein HQ526_02835 [Actinobacteria bacterium]|nr:hypothetical protein [Actinomycetota bacterium]
MSKHPLRIPPSWVSPPDVGNNRLDGIGPAFSISLVAPAAPDGVSDLQVASDTSDVATGLALPHFEFGGSAAFCGENRTFLTAALGDPNRQTTFAAAVAAIRNGATRN